MVMVFVMAPIVTAVDAEVALGTTSLSGVELKSGTPTQFEFLRSLDGGTATKFVGESGLWQRLPRYTIKNGYGNTIAEYIPEYYAVPKSESVSVTNEGIIGNINATLVYSSINGYTDCPCIQLEYTALAVGSTDVTFTYYYNYNESGINGGTTWYKETVTFNVNVVDGEVSKPNKPTVSDIERFTNYVNTTSSSKGAVYMWCAENLNDHGAWFSYITDVDDAYTLGDVVANDGSVLSAATYPWICVMTLDANKYLDAYNSEMSVPHYLADGQSEFVTVTWYYNASLNKWQYKSSNAPVYIDITHTSPVVEYTVTYTDGVNGTAFADQTYTVKSGDATPAFEGTPTRDGYVFLGWEPEVAQTVTGNATYTAVWEEALTDVTVKSSIKKDKLLFLHDTFTVTATANTSANINIAVENAAINPISTAVSEDGKSTTVTYEVVKITGTYTIFNFTATATKGSQTPVDGTLSYGVNLRNRIHFTLMDTNGNFKDNAENVKLMHQYAKWNKCPSLKVSGEEYVMASPWDLCNEPYISLDFDYNGVHYSTNVDMFGNDLKSVTRAGTSEIYVEYVVVNPIKVTINVNGKTVDEQSFNGSNEAVLDYSDMLKNAISSIFSEDKNIVSLTTEGLNADGEAVFGSTENVVVNITVK